MNKPLVFVLPNGREISIYPTTAIVGLILTFSLVIIGCLLFPDLMVDLGLSFVLVGAIVIGVRTILE